MASTTEEDWRVIQQRLAAIAEMEWLRAHSLHQSSGLLRMIDQINGPLINASSDKEHGFGLHRANKTSE